MLKNLENLKVYIRKYSKILIKKSSICLEEETFKVTF